MAPEDWLEPKLEKSVSASILFFNFFADERVCENIFCCLLKSKYAQTLNVLTNARVHENILFSSRCKVCANILCSYRCKG